MLTLVKTPRFAAIAASAVAIALAIAACSSGDDDGGNTDGETVNHCEDATRVVEAQTGYAPVLISSDLAAGMNRLALGLVDHDQNGAPVAGAELDAQFCQFGAEEVGAELIFESNLSAITAERSFTHIHEDGELHQHEVGEVGVYITNVDFPAAGDYQVFVYGAVGEEELEPKPYFFQVQETTQSPAIGEPAPRSVQTTIDDVEDITQIDTSTPPNPEMHSMTIADAVTSGRPTVVVFATPAFCLSQICGPTKEVVDDLYPRYEDRVNFVHVEPYEIEPVRSGDCVPPYTDCLVPALSEWGLRSEPWIFTVDSEGNVAGKFEGVVGQGELDEHLQTLLATG